MVSALGAIRCGVEAEDVGILSLYIVRSLFRLQGKNAQSSTDTENEGIRSKQADGSGKEGNLVQIVSQPSGPPTKSRSSMGY
jgi:hypothetical protein